MHGQSDDGKSQDRSQVEQSEQQGLPGKEMHVDERLYVVGIGASAGGLDALRTLLPQLPTKIAITYVIIQHQSPKRKSMLAEILRSSIELPVSEVTEKVTIQPQHVYIAPANSDLVIADDQLVPVPYVDGSKAHPSVDRFFTSLAENLAERSIGVVLSGSGADGVLGMLAIKEAGGYTIAQLPSSAGQRGMPQAAIDSDGSDLVLEPGDIGHELGRLLRASFMREKQRPPLAEPRVMQQLLAKVKFQAGVDFSHYKRPTIDRRVARRIALHKLDDVTAYLDFIEENPDEIEALRKDILISVTSFFRDKEAFESLARMLPELCAAKTTGDSFRAWVAGCATGEEAYTIALLVEDTRESLSKELEISIFATDIDPEAVAVARAGRYPAACLAEVPPRFVSRHFTHQGQRYLVRQSLRETLVFACQDVVHDPPFSRLDLLSCRNLLIYLEPELQRRLIERFHYALQPGGLLLLGKSESVGGLEKLFEPVDTRWRIFRRRAKVRPTSWRSSNSVTVRADKAKSKGEIPRPSLRQVAHQAAVEALDVRGVLVNEQRQVVHVLGDIGDLLQLGEGDARLDVLDLVPDVVRAPLRAALHKSMREYHPVQVPPIRWESTDGTPVQILLCIHPVDVEGAPDALTLIRFERSPILSASSAVQLIVPDCPDQRITDLELELSVTRQQLQTTMEELEAANEELQSLNEELQSANEELQSSNEELETSNEEMQATNEELTTVNDELALRSSDLAQANADLENILTRMGLPLIVVDAEGLVRRFTPQAANLFHLAKGEQGLSLTSVGCNLSLPGLPELLARVIVDNQYVEQTVSGGGRHYELKAFPFVVDEGKHQGAILTFYDQTEQYRREQEFKALADHAPDIVARFDRELRHQYVNRSVCRVTGLSPEHYIGKTNRELGMPLELCEQWDTTIAEVFARGQERKMRFSFPAQNGELQFEARMVPEFSPDGHVTSVLSVARDLTELLAAEESARKAESHLHSLLNSFSEGFFALDRQLQVTFFNRAAGQLLGCSPADVIGRPLLDVFPEARGSVFEQRYRQAIEEQKEQSFEVRFEEEPYVNWFKVRVFPSEEGIIVFFRVTTKERQALAERERLESELRHAHKMESVGTLASGVAHEFNNLLAVVLGNADLLADELGQEHALYELVDEVRLASRRGRELVRDLSAFGRKTDSELRPLNINEELERGVGILTNTLPRMLNLDVALESSSPYVCGASDQLQQVLLNLAANARDAMPAGGTLRVATELVELSAEDEASLSSLPPGQYVRLTVEDTGSGMEPHVVERIFDPFFTTKAVGRGTGLGLSVVYRIVQDHHGRIVCDSALGKGTVFRIDLPCCAKPEDAATEIPEPALEKTFPQGTGETVLLVDDEPSVRAVAARMLERSGYRVVTADSGEKAIEVYVGSDEQIALVVLDLGMPGMGGEAALSALLERDPRARVIVASGYTDGRSAERAMRNGAAAFLEKPFDTQDLLETVQETLDRQQ